MSQQEKGMADSHDLCVSCDTPTKFGAIFKGSPAAVVIALVCERTARRPCIRACDRSWLPDLGRQCFRQDDRRRPAHRTQAGDLPVVCR